MRTLCRAETIPPGEDGDVWVLRHILHDWNDAKACAILSNLRRAIGSAKVTLVIGEVKAGRECCEFMRSSTPSCVLHGADASCLRCRGMLNVHAGIHIEIGSGPTALAASTKQHGLLCVRRVKARHWRAENWPPTDCMLAICGRWVASGSSVPLERPGTQSLMMATAFSLTAL